MAILGEGGGLCVVFPLVRGSGMAGVGLHHGCAVLLELAFV
jgi:hypothetical protein